VRGDENLKNWKPDTLLGLVAIKGSVFQNFRFSPITGTGKGVLAVSCYINLYTAPNVTSNTAF
jgi:hypothetical protein